MLIGVLSDTHDHLDRLAAALRHFREAGVEAVLHAGDLVAPFAAKTLKQWTGPLYVVYGNNDGERKGLKSVLPQITDGPIPVDCGGRRISLDHYPPSTERPAVEGADIVIFGHTHELSNEQRDGVLYLNPGECCGWVNGRATVAVLDTDKLEARIVDVATVS
ncbi:MAG: metallophosphoesterase [Planctomycetes bacterium]|nr:metallophosphoesterase [Planctomycetota bacterium]